MKITYLGHSCFLIEGNFASVLFDPYEGKGVANPIVSADIVVTSHNHWDHNAVNRVAGEPMIVDKCGEYYYKGVAIRSIPTFHDSFSGAKRGPNMVTIITIDDINICHLGDLGEEPSNELLEKIGKIDLLLTPIGGLYTIGAVTAMDYVGALRPKITIPMHYYNANYFTEVGKLEDFVKLWHNDRIIHNKFNYLEIVGELPQDTLIVMGQ